MKRIIFQKLTVKETAHIQGASLNRSDTPSTMSHELECEDISMIAGVPACENATDNVIDCGHPALPHVECSNTVSPSGDCGVIS